MFLGTHNLLKTEPILKILAELDSAYQIAEHIVTGFLILMLWSCRIWNGDSDVFCEQNSRIFVWVHQVRSSDVTPKAESE
jgi:hypothetical protein